METSAEHSYLQEEATKVINIVLERQTSYRCLATSTSSFTDPQRKIIVKEIRRKKDRYRNIIS